MKKSNDSFWPSYTDLMTSLFFIMLVLYVLTYVRLNSTIKLQKEKIEIYEENEKCRASLSYAEQKIVAEKTEHKKTSDKYYRIKSFMGYLAGAFLALLYLRVGSTILAALLSSVGPWGFILQFLGPVGAFAAGYFLVQLYF